jgi:hypothetical protein
MEEKEIDVKRLDGAPQIGHRGTKTPSSRSQQNEKSCSGAACSALIYD